MFKRFSRFHLRKLATIGLVGATTLVPATMPFETAKASPSFFEYRWDNSTKYKRLYYLQGSRERRDRSTYYLVLKPNDRRTAILKLKIKFPEYFDSRISTNKLSLCQVSLGGMLARTRCKKKIPAVFEVSKDPSQIEVFPDTPIPVEDSYAIVMKIFNPTQAGMYQLNASVQSPGDVPVSSYIGTWNIDID